MTDFAAPFLAALPLALRTAAETHTDLNGNPKLVWKTTTANGNQVITRVVGFSSDGSQASLQTLATPGLVWFTDPATLAAAVANS